MAWVIAEGVQELVPAYTPPFPVPFNPPVFSGWPSSVASDEAVLVFVGGTPLYYRSFVPNTVLVDAGWDVLADGDKVGVYVQSGAAVPSTLTLSSNAGGVWRCRWYHVGGLDTNGGAWDHGVRRVNYVTSSGAPPNATSDALPGLVIAFCSLIEDASATVSGILLQEDYTIPRPWWGPDEPNRQAAGWADNRAAAAVTAGCSDFGGTTYNHVCMVEFGGDLWPVATGIHLGLALHM